MNLKKGFREVFNNDSQNFVLQKQIVFQKLDAIFNSELVLKLPTNLIIIGGGVGNFFKMLSFCLVEFEFKKYLFGYMSKFVSAPKLLKSGMLLKQAKTQRNIKPCNTEVGE